MNRCEIGHTFTHLFAGISLFATGNVYHANEAGSSSAQKTRSLNPEEALRKLLAGNQRFAGSVLKNPHHSTQWRTRVAEEQHPFAIILTCSDSRVPPEIIFDEGLGDLFVIRNAGHIPDDAVLGSIEYAVGHLGVGLIVVMGHENCGAVKASVDVVMGEMLPGGHLNRMVNTIRPAVESVKDQAGDLIDLAVRSNVQQTVRKISKAPPLLDKKIAADEIRVVGARYDLHSGQVEII
jgi:carbonic anhydrase